MFALADVLTLLALAFGVTQVVIPLAFGRPVFPWFQSERLLKAKERERQAKIELEAAEAESRTAELQKRVHRKAEETLAVQLDDLLGTDSSTHTGASAPLNKEKQHGS